MRSGLCIEYYKSGTEGTINKDLREENVSGWAAYVGDFQGGKKHGKGTWYKNSNGKVYIGE